MYPEMRWMHRRNDIITMERNVVRVRVSVLLCNQIAMCRKTAY